MFDRATFSSHDLAVPDRLLKAFTVNQENKFIWPNHIRSIWPIFRRWDMLRGSGRDELDFEEAEELRQWCQYFGEVSDEVSIFLTDAGLLGVAPGDVRALDELVILQGAFAPVNR